jgi:hypothetical protein
MEAGDGLAVDRQPPWRTVRHGNQLPHLGLLAQGLEDGPQVEALELGRPLSRQLPVDVFQG